MSDFFRQNVLILSEVFGINGKEQEGRKKIGHNRAKKKFTLLREFDRRNTLFEISRNLIQKAVFK